MIIYIYIYIYSRLRRLSRLIVRRLRAFVVRGFVRRLSSVSIGQKTLSVY